MKPKPVDTFSWIRLVEAYRGAGLITSAQARVLTILATFTKYVDGTGAFPGRRRLAVSSNASPSTIARAKTIGIECGLLRVTGEKRRKGGTFTVYDLAWPSDVPADVSSRLVGHAAVDDHDVHDVDPVPSRGEPGRDDDLDDVVPSRGEPGDLVLFGGRPGSISARPGSLQGGTRTPNTERSEVVVGDVAAAPGGAAPSLPADVDEIETRRWLADFSAAKRKPYHDLATTTLGALIDEADRVRRLGWHPVVAAGAVSGLHAKPDSPHGLIASRLRDVGPFEAASVVDPASLAVMIVADIEYGSDRYDVDALDALDELDLDGEAWDYVVPDLLVRCGACTDREQADDCWQTYSRLACESADKATRHLVDAFTRNASPKLLRAAYDDLPSIVLDTASRLPRRNPSKRPARVAAAAPADEWQPGF